MLLHSTDSGVIGNKRGKLMKRIESALRAGVALAALAPFATAAQAQSTLPPPNVVTGQAPPAEKCDASKQNLESWIPYTADYYFYAP